MTLKDRGEDVPVRECEFCGDEFFTAKHHSEARYCSKRHATLDRRTLDV